MGWSNTFDKAMLPAAQIDEDYNKNKCKPASRLKGRDPRLNPDVGE